MFRKQSAAIATILALGLGGSGCGDSNSGKGGGGGGGGDTTKPTVVSISIADNATDIARDASIVVVFSEAIAQSTLSATTLSLEDSSSAAVATSHTYDPATYTVTVTPDATLANFADYTFSVTTGITDTAGNALAAGDSVSFTTADDVAPAAPGAPTDAGLWSTSTSIAFDWTAPTDDGSGVASYWLQVGTTNDGNNLVVDTNVGNVLTYPHTGTDADTLYARVAAVDASGNQGSFSSFSDGIGIDATAPAAAGTPSLAGAVDDATVTVNWTAASDDNSGIAGYVLEVATDDAGTTVVDTVALGDVLTLDYDATLQNGEMLYFRASAADVAGNSGPWSAWSAGTLVDTTAPNTPAAPSDRGDYSRATILDFDWLAPTDAGSGVDHYIIRIATADDGSGIVDTQTLGNVLTYAHSNALDAVTYYASIAAVDAAGNQSDWSPWSDGITVKTTVPGKPGTPDDGADYFNSGDITFTWTAAVGTVSNYVIEIGSTPGADDLLSATNVVPTTYTFSPTSPTAGDTFYARVAAFDGTYQGAWSDSSDGITFDDTNPTSPGAPMDEGDLSDAMVDFTWAAASDAQSGIAEYTIQISTSTDPGDVFVEATVTDPGYTFDARGWGDRTVYARVVATNGAELVGDWSGWSDGIDVDATFPQVWAVSPEYAFDTASTATDIVLYFSEPMDTASVEAAFRLLDASDGDAAPAHGYAFFWDEKQQTLTVQPDTADPAGITNIDLLTPEHVYDVTVLTTATDAAGNGLMEWASSFTVAEVTPPELSFAMAGSTNIENGPVSVTDVEGGDTIVFTFNEPMYQNRARIELRSYMGREELRAEIQERGVRNAYGDGTYVTYELDGEHQLNPGDPVVITETGEAKWNFDGVVFDVLDPQRFRVERTATGTFTCCGRAVYRTGDGASVEWTSSTELTFTLDGDRSLMPGEYRLEVGELGDALGNWTWVQMTLQVYDPTADDSQDPILLGHLPLDGDSAASQLLPIFIAFDEPIHVGTLDDIVLTGVAPEDYVRIYPLEQFGPAVAFVPLGAWPAGDTISVTVPNTLTDVAGNPLQGATSFSFTVETRTGGTAPVLAESLPAAGATAYEIREANVAFADGTTGELTLLDMSTFDPADILVVDDTTGMVRRGWTPHNDRQGPVVRLRPPPRMDGFTSYRVRVEVTGATGDGERAIYTTSGPHGMSIGTRVTVRMRNGGDGQFNADDAVVTWVSTTEPHEFAIDAFITGSSVSGGDAEFGTANAYTVTIADNAVTKGDGIIDLAGNAVAASSFSFAYSPGPENRSPSVRELDDVRANVEGAPNARVLSVSFDIRDPDGDVVDVTITSPDVSGLAIISSIDTSVDSRFSTTQNGGDGPPDTSNVAALDPSNFDATGPITLVITLDDRTDSVTYERTAFVWATADLPVLDDVGGVTVSSSSPVLINDSTPTFNWTMNDTANPDVIQAVVADISALGDNGPPQGFFTFHLLDPATETLTLPQSQSMPIGLYAWLVVQSRMPYGFGDPIGSGWTLDLVGDPPPMHSFFVYGPSNSNLETDVFAEASFGVEVLQDEQGMRGMWSTFGDVVFDGTVNATLNVVNYDAADLTPSAIDGWYAYDSGSKELMLAVLADGPPTPFRGAMGRNEQLLLLNPQVGEWRGDQDQRFNAAYFIVGAHRFQTQDWLAEDLNGGWAWVQVSVHADGGGAFNGFGGVMGTAVATGDAGAATGTFDSIVGVDHAGGNVTPDPSAYTLSPEGRLSFAIGASETAYGYVGGAAGAEIIPCSGVTDGTFIWWELVVKAHTWGGSETVADVSGTYNLVNINLERNGTSGELIRGETVRGTAEFSGAAGPDNLSYSIETTRGLMTGTDTYAVDTGAKRVTFDAFQCLAGPDFDTLLCMQVGDPDRVEMMILTK